MIVVTIAWLLIYGFLVLPVMIRDNVSEDTRVFALFIGMALALLIDAFINMLRHGDDDDRLIR